MFKCYSYPTCDWCHGRHKTNLPTVNIFHYGQLNCSKWIQIQKSIVLLLLFMYLAMLLTTALVVFLWYCYFEPIYPTCIALSCRTYMYAS